MTTDRTPPSAPETEQSVLGAVLQNTNALDTAIEHLEPDDFWLPRHRKIFKAIVELRQSNRAVDLITVPEKLAADLEGVGGRRYLMDLTDSVVLFDNIGDHCKIIKDCSTKNQLIYHCADIQNGCYGKTSDATELLESAERGLFKIADGKTKSPIVKVSSFLTSVYDNLDKNAWGLRTGLLDLDNMTYGLHKGDLIIVAGRPSMGKTSLADGIIDFVAIEQKTPVLMFSLEMSKEDIVKRLMYARARVPGERSRNGRKISDEEWAKLSAVTGPIHDAPIHFDDTPSISALEIRSRSRRMKMREGIGLVVVDYMQLVRGQKNPESRNQEITFISQMLKATAREINVPVVALSQLSRAVEKRGADARPQLSDLRDGGSIEQDSDVIIFIHRDRDKAGVLQAESEIIVSKQRQGPTGVVKATFIKDYAKFENYSGAKNG